MTIAFVTSIKVEGTNSTTGTVDTSGANFIAIFTSSQANTATVSDNKGNSYSNGTAFGISPYGRWHWCAAATVGTGHTFTNVANFTAMQVYAFSGVATVSPSEGATTGQQGLHITSPAQPGSITPAAAGNLFLLGTAGSANAIGGSIDLGFTIGFDVALSGGVNFQGASAYMIQGAAAATNPTWTFTSNGGEIAGGLLMESFKAGASATTSLIAPPRRGPHQRGMIVRPRRFR